MKIKICKTLAMAIVLFISFSSGRSQSLAEFREMPPSQKAKLVADSLKNAIHLGDKQYPQVYGILLDGALKAQLIIKSDCSKFIKRYKLKSLLADEELKLKAALTSYQFKLLEKKKEEIIAWGKQHRSELTKGVNGF